MNDVAGSTVSTLDMTAVTNGRNKNCLHKGLHGSRSRNTLQTRVVKAKCCLNGNGYRKNMCGV